jgi:hypothetical protein
MFILNNLKISGHEHNDNKLDGTITYIKSCCYLEEIFSAKIIPTQLSVPLLSLSAPIRQYVLSKGEQS